MSDKVMLTIEGASELRNELKWRLEEERKRIADDIERARQQGDLSENSAYKAALENKEFNEVKIQEIESTLANSEIVKRMGKGKVELGSKVEVIDVEKNSKRVFEIVGENEADPVSGKISLKSPLASVLINKRVGSSVIFKTPAGESKYKILTID